MVAAGAGSSERNHIKHIFTQCFGISLADILRGLRAAPLVRAVPARKKTNASGLTKSSALLTAFSHSLYASDIRFVRDAAVHRQ